MGTFYFKVSSIYRLYSKYLNCQFSYNFYNFTIIYYNVIYITLYIIYIIYYTYYIHYTYYIIYYTLYITIVITNDHRGVTGETVASHI